MRRGLDTHKAVKRVLPKHKHHFDSLFVFKPDDEDANDSDSDSLEDVLDQPPAKRKGPFLNSLKTSGDWRRKGQKDAPAKGEKYACAKSLKNQ